MADLVIPRGATIYNPLGAALAHYTRETEWVLRHSGAAVRTVVAMEPSASGGSRIVWALRAYVTLLWLAVTRPNDVVIVTWPVLGYIDAIWINLVLGRRGVLVMHDPVPLVQAVGYGSRTRAIAQRLRRVTFVAHSQRAHEVMRAQGLATSIVVKHPVIRAEDGPRTTSPVIPRVTLRIVVLGQFKRDRDLRLMEELASLGAVRAEFFVHGRGWPQVPGWEVEDRFLSESELDEVIKSAHVILIPYRRFYQSGIAIRALELGTPVVGPRDSILADVFQGCVTNLAQTTDAAEWWDCSLRAAKTTPFALEAELDRYARDVAQSWSAILEGLPHA